jgi:hypothetical protein
VREWKGDDATKQFGYKEDTIAVRKIGMVRFIVVLRASGFGDGKLTSHRSWRNMRDVNHDHKCGSKIAELVCAIERKEGLKRGGEGREGDFDRLTLGWK